MLRTFTTPATRYCSGAVIYLHGSGGTGIIAKEGLKFDLGEEFSFPHLQVLYPTAPAVPYSLNGGILQNIWFDRLSLSYKSPEHLESIETSAMSVDRIIEKCVIQGIPPHRIIVGGFSMGGCFSLHIGYRYRRDLRGIFCLSSYLSEGSKVYEDLSDSEGMKPPLFMATGTKDSLIDFEWSQSTHKHLHSLGVDATFHTFENMDHEHCTEEILMLKDWIIKLLPEDQS